MKNKSIKSNIIYNILLQLFNISFPLITGAYVSRTLGAENLGKINFSQSIIGWLIIIASLGIPTYGMREIAKNRDNREESNKIFSELVILRLVVSIVLLLVYYISINYVPQFRNQNKLFIITGLGLIFNLFNIDWFFSGIEDYKMISIRNIVVRIATFAMIVYFVKEESDYLIYALLLILSQGISSSWSYFYSNKFVKFTIKELNCFRHVNIMKVFLFSSLVVSCYTTFNGILLGILSDSKSVAYYIRAYQILIIAAIFTNSISTVLVPRISYYYANEREKYFYLLKKTLNYNYVLSIPMATAVMLLAKPINFVLGGVEFLPAAKALMIISPLIIVGTLGNWGYNQIIIPTGQEKYGLKIQIFMATINIVLNVLLIPRYSYIGVAISVLISETIGPAISFWLLKRNIEIKLLTNNLKNYIFSSIAMSCVIYILALRFNNLKLLIVSAFFGSLTYLICLILFEDDIILEIINLFKNKIWRKNNG